MIGDTCVQSITAIRTIIRLPEALSCIVAMAMVVMGGMCVQSIVYCNSTTICCCDGRHVCSKYDGFTHYYLLVIVTRGYSLLSFIVTVVMVAMGDICLYKVSRLYVLLCCGRCFIVVGGEHIAMAMVVGHICTQWSYRTLSTTYRLIRCLRLFVLPCNLVCIILIFIVIVVI